MAPECAQEQNFRDDSRITSLFLSGNITAERDGYFEVAEVILESPLRACPEIVVGRALLLVHGRFEDSRLSGVPVVQACLLTPLNFGACAQCALSGNAWQNRSSCPRINMQFCAGTGDPITG